MALANYTNLLASIATWLARADLTAQIPDFVQLAEARFNRILRTRVQETRAQLNITGEYVTLPNDFLEFRSGYLNSSPRRPLQFLPNDTQTVTYSDPWSPTWGNSQPAFFSIEGDSFRFAPVPGGADTAYIQYYSKIPPLVLNATNWLLTAHPDLYLFGSLLAATANIQDDPRLGLWKAGFDEALQEINSSAKRARYGGGSMRVRAA